MKLGELNEILADYPDDLEVVVRVDSDTADTVDSGEILQVTDARNIVIEYGKLTIIGDYVEKE